MKAKSQNLCILGYLSSGKTLTPLQALNKFDCWALSSRVSELNKQGHRIKSELVKVGNKVVARYSK